MRIALLVLIAASAGCHSTPQSLSVNREQANLTPNQVLAGPYELRLSVSSATANPGEYVLVGVEFENSGSVDLWAPPRQEVFLGYRYQGPMLFMISGPTGRSHCSGMNCVRLRPGEKVKYELPFEVPRPRGKIEIYTDFRDHITTPLIVEG